jgi:site-specific DNA-methyltransferase (adenine-specific)
MTYTLHTGDCREVMATLPAESVDAIVCDPPYGLSFMGKGWDYGVPGVDFWVEALRVLKPGGHLIAFGGTRTYHRLAVAIENAGFEVRDCLMWLYGSGFPKSHDVSKAMDKQAGVERIEGVRVWKGGKRSGGIVKDNDNELTSERIIYDAPSTDLAKKWHGWGTALKPAYEPAILARKPLRGTVADNVAQWGVGGLNIDGCRVGTDVLPEQKAGQAKIGTFERYNMTTPERIGRWPANVILDEEAAAALDEQSGNLGSIARKNKKPAAVLSQGIYGDYGASAGPAGYSDTGGASRFFYTAKASRSEREAGLDGVEVQSIGAKGNGLGRTCEVCGASVLEGCSCENRTYSNQKRANHHPTVKPIALMRYMIRLVAPRGTVVLDPFMGSGSTGCAAMVEGMQFIGIDITPEYVDIARRRLAWWSCSLDGNAIINAEEDEA